MSGSDEAGEVGRIGHGGEEFRHDTKWDRKMLWGFRTMSSGLHFKHLSGHNIGNGL